jgi:hypothetical protein
MVDQLKIHKTILSDSLELSGLAQFQGQEVEITISPITRPKTNFMRFAGIAAHQAALLEDLEQDITANRALDLRRAIDLNNWLRAAASNPVFNFLHDPEEDIYTLNHGKPLSNEK